MTDPQVLRTTLEAIDRLVADLTAAPANSATASPSTGRADHEPIRYVVDEGRAAAEWTLTVPHNGGTAELGIVVVCDVDDGQLSGVRLYSAIAVEHGPVT